MSEREIADEVREALKQLVDETHALSARIVSDDESIRTGVPARTLALGGGEFLRVELPTRTPKEPADMAASGDGGNESTGPIVDLEAAFDRVTRQLRTIRRRWDAMRLPEVAVTSGTSTTAPVTRDRITERIGHFLQALASIDRASNAFCIRGTQLIAAAKDPDELEATRWPFLSRRALATHAPGSSHGEIIDPDAYAMSFWYDAAIVVLLADPYATDFVRHRCRQVARELSNLLPMLEPDPGAPASIRRRPPTIP